MKDLAPLHFFDAYFRAENEGLIRTYTDAWHHVPEHYPPGWCYAFWEPNRFLNRVIYHHLTSTGFVASVLDFGCYDGLLLAALVDQGFDARGYESLPCEAMFKALGVSNRVNTKTHCEAVIAFGVAQEYSFESFLKRIEEENNGLPDILFFDREPTRPTIHNKTYFEPMFILKHGIQVTQFPNCISNRSCAELLIWSKHANR